MSEDREHERHVIDALARIETKLEPIPGQIETHGKRLDSIERAVFRGSLVIATIATMLGAASHSVVNFVKVAFAALDGHGR